MNRFSSRKFLLSFASLLVNAWLVSEQVIDAATYKAILIATVGAYIAGNVAQKALVKDGTAQ